jgi:hypothetical protein
VAKQYKKKGGPKKPVPGRFKKRYELPYAYDETRDEMDDIELMAWEESGRIEMILPPESEQDELTRLLAENPIVYLGTPIQLRIAELSAKLKRKVKLERLPTIPLNPEKSAVPTSKVEAVPNANAVKMNTLKLRPTQSLPFGFKEEPKDIAH